MKNNRGVILVGKVCKIESLLEKNNKKKGFILIETMVYITMASIILSVLVLIAVISMKTYKHYYARTYLRQSSMKFDDFLEYEIKKSCSDLLVDYKKISDTDNKKYGIDFAATSIRYIKNENPREKGIKNYHMILDKEAYFKDLTKVSLNREFRYMSLDKEDVNIYRIKTVYYYDKQRYESIFYIGL